MTKLLNLNTVVQNLPDTLKNEVNIENGMISYKAPIARAIIGKSINDVIEFESALGQEVYKIHKIEYI